MHVVLTHRPAKRCNRILRTDVPNHWCTRQALVTPPERLSPVGGGCSGLLAHRRTFCLPRVRRQHQPEGGIVGANIVIFVNDLAADPVFDCIATKSIT